jgi:hypothetical protein
VWLEGDPGSVAVSAESEAFEMSSREVERPAEAFGLTTTKNGLSR